jgi:DNA (cytosine-5)-methyltransferase 1
LKHPTRPDYDGQTLRFYRSDTNHPPCVVSHNFSRAAGSRAMGIDWMTRDELAQAVPPAYTEYIARFVRDSR